MPNPLMELRSQEVRRLAFHELMQRVRAEDVPEGLSETSKRVLLNERIEGLADRLVSGFGLRVFLDLEAFNFVSDGIDQQWWEEVMLKFFILHQASTAMIQAMFPGTTRTEISQHRRALNAVPPGKPSALPDAEVDQIYQAWRELSESTPDLRERYFQMHERFSRYSLTTLFATLHMK